MSTFTPGGSSDPSISMLMRELQNQGLSDEQISRVLASPQQSKGTANSKDNNHLSAITQIAAMANGNPLLAAGMAMHNRTPPMSQNDGVYIRQVEPDASGAYETSDQKLQDAYNSTPAGQRKQNAGRQGEPHYYSNVGDLNLPPVGISNPNYRVSYEGSNVSVNDNGNIVRW